MYDPLNVYRGKYKEFIEGIVKERPLNEYFDYSSRHHVIPECCGGKDNDEENIRIHLTHREHFIAHRILSEENPENEKLFYAYWRMCNGRVTKATPEEYEEARKRFSDSQRGENNPACKPGIGKKISDAKKNPSLETRMKISISKSGKNNPNYGGLPDTTKKKISESLRGNTNNRGKSWTIKSGYRKVHPTSYKVVCRLCGREFTGTSANSRYCDDCKKGL